MVASPSLHLLFLLPASSLPNMLYQPTDVNPTVAAACWFIRSAITLQFQEGRKKRGRDRIDRTRTGQKTRRGRGRGWAGHAYLPAFSFLTFLISISSLYSSEQTRKDMHAHALQKGWAVGGGGPACAQKNKKNKTCMPAATCLVGLLWNRFEHYCLPNHSLSPGVLTYFA